MLRKEDNIKLLQELLYLVAKYDDLRFSQILDVFGFVKAQRPVKDRGRISWQNEFNVEPDVLLARVKRYIKNIEKQQEK